MKHRKLKQQPHQRKSFRNMMIWLAVLVVFISELLFYTWCRVNCIRVGYDISRSTMNYHNLLTLQSNLKIELARLKSPERIAEIAKNRLGLAMPEQRQMITIR